jgi:alpha-tubulin suppressor-like RCC1 family protein
MILRTDGTLWATGLNTSGQLGDATKINKSTPVQIMSSVAAVAAGGTHTLILKTDGSLWATGDNTYGQFGNGTSGVGSSSTIPVRIM